MLTNTTLVYLLQNKSYLLSVSQKSNKLKKKQNTTVPRRLKDSQRIKRKKVGTNPQRSPSSISCSKQNQLQGQVRLLRALSNSVLKNFQDWKLQNSLGTRSSAFSLLPWKTFLLTSSCYFPCYSLIAPLILSLYIPRFSRAKCPLISVLHWFYSPTTEASLSPMNFSKSATELRATEAGPACFLRWLTIPS